MCEIQLLIYQNKEILHQGHLTGSTGLKPDRLHAIAQMFNLTIETKLVNDKQYGKLLENGSWTGCVGMLTTHEAGARFNWKILA